MDPVLVCRQESVWVFVWEVNAEDESVWEKEGENELVIEVLKEIEIFLEMLALNEIVDWDTVAVKDAREVWEWELEPTCVADSELLMEHVGEEVSDDKDNVVVREGVLLIE